MALKVCTRCTLKMKCARLQLRERTKGKTKVEIPKSVGKPRRYCQKRLINPEHEEDPRWTDALERFHCNNEFDSMDSAIDFQNNRNSEELCLTVQTLKFPGDVETELIKRPKTSFKFKTVTSNKHRMFVKQPVMDNDFNEDDRSSQLTSYYFDDYVKYLFNNDKSRPNSGTSSIFLRGISATVKQNKATQAEITRTEENKERSDIYFTQGSVEKSIKNETEVKNGTSPIENAKIRYSKTGRRKSLTISRTQSPETVQVIRVDVVCNTIRSAPSDNEDSDVLETNINNSEYKTENISLKNTQFAKKYLLTQTIKTLDQNLPRGTKVTLLCKTFKLSDRAKVERHKIEDDRKHTKTHRDATNNRKQLMK